MRTQSELFPPNVLNYFSNAFENRLRTVGDQINRKLPITENMVLGYSATEIAEAVLGTFYTLSNEEKIAFMRLIAPKGVTVNEPN